MKWWTVLLCSIAGTVIGVVSLAALAWFAWVKPWWTGPLGVTASNYNLLWIPLVICSAIATGAVVWAAVSLHRIAKREV